jgi:hypothetical protein
VRPLKHQNITNVKAENEIINRFEKTHGTDLQLVLPYRPPLSARP